RRRRRARPGARHRAVRAVQLAGPSGLRRQRALRDAPRLRGPRSAVGRGRVVRTSTTGDALVLFGATADLALKKLFPALYELERRGALGVPVTAVARSKWSDDDLRAFARSSVEKRAERFDPAVFDRLAGRLSMCSGGYDAPTTYEHLAQRLGGAARPGVFPGGPPPPVR